MKKFALLLPILMALPHVAFADEMETKLYNSCLAANNTGNAQTAAMCQCQAKKWASGKVVSPQDPSKSMDIKKEYVDTLIADWNHNIGVSNGANLKGKEAEQAVIAMNIGFACAKELGGIK